ncbi:GNAT family N-acetyltransferase [Ammoniphilus sp. CFH 90114]|uniref:GNAT family N-acetyltransferase n=1 Tax=Ammoniphilus sp. CFH 90114 TaxID=2493665 RepID=UPI00100EC5B4|nr:GNAT family N-acetyltransferase [Ammoniphilus sp. CFH 90114]RXT15317.1 GNAT family N-acetyltransferase [Ammoniphilus sp. CFH 90114]
MIKYQNCIDVEDRKIHEAFQAGFSDYLVKMEFTCEEFIKRFFGAEGNERAYSYIAMDEDRPVGVILGGIKIYEGLKTMRCGTLCIDPSYRKEGIAEQLFSLHKSQALAQGCKQLFLEVIKGNDKAIKFYEKQGYQKMYDLKIFSLHNIDQKVLGTSVKNIVPIALEQLSQIRLNTIDTHLNWQNDIEFIEKVDGQLHFGYLDEGDVQGVISANPMGRIHFLWVSSKSRGKGIASSLVTHVINHMELSNVTVTFPNHANLEGFYKHLGFKQAELSQFEMYLTI